MEVEPFAARLHDSGSPGGTRMRQFLTILSVLAVAGFVLGFCIQVFG
jgi:hypothetical protein